MSNVLSMVNNKCRCGAIASGIKEETLTARGAVKSKRMVASNCTQCGLYFIAEDYKTIIDDTLLNITHNLTLYGKTDGTGGVRKDKQAQERDQKAKR